ncbi:lysine 5,6-aminomutase reactivase subunit KamB [Fervidobacterium sp.]
MFGIGRVEEHENDFEKLINEILKRKVIAIIGLEKNTGKTETLNFIVKHVSPQKRLALTSIGTDGEEKDLVFGTFKPSVYVDYGFVYTTTELFFKRKTVLSEIIHVSHQHTPTGRVIIAKALEPGKVVLSGPPTATWMEETVRLLKEHSDTVIIDGALSRFSQATPFIADGIVLATGAAYSLDKREIVKHTRYVYSLCQLSEACMQAKERLVTANTVHVFQSGDWKDLGIESALLLTKVFEISLGEDTKKIYIPGALTDNVLRFLSTKGIDEIIVRDFTKIFVSYESYMKYKPTIRVLKSANIIGITVNPFSPTGYVLNSHEIIGELKKHVDVPVIDVKLETVKNI